MPDIAHPVFAATEAPRGFFDPGHRHRYGQLRLPRDGVLQVDAGDIVFAMSARHAGRLPSGCFRRRCCNNRLAAC